MLDAYLLSFASTWTGHLHSLDPLGTRWSRLKRVTEILGLADNLFILKFHDTHRIRWLPIVSEDEFGHPEIGSTNNSPHSKSLVVRLRHSRRLNSVAAANPLARLRILKHRVLSVNLMFGIEIVGETAKYCASYRSLRLGSQSSPLPEIPRCSVSSRTCYYEKLAA